MDVETVAVAGEWIRHAPHRSELLGRAAEPTDGRWQRGEAVRALYLADESATAIAEWYRLLAERGLPPSGRSTSNSSTSALPSAWRGWVSTRRGQDDAPGRHIRRSASSCSASGTQGSSRPAPPARRR